MNVYHFVKLAMKKFLDSKIAFLWAVILGVLVGHFFPVASQPLGKIGDLFINFANMCVLPIIVTSISLSIAYLMKNQISESIKRIVSIFMFLTLISCLLGTGTATLFQTGKDLNPKGNEKLQHFIEEANKGVSPPHEVMEERLAKSTLELIIKAVPSNIFEALAKNNIFQIIIFSIVFGAALGMYLDTDAHLMHVIRQTLEVFSQIFEGIVYIFPLVFALMITRDYNELGSETAIGLGIFCLQFLCAALILFIISTIIIMVRTKTSLLQSLEIMRDPILIAFATQSTTAAIPPSIMSLKRFHYDENLVQLLVPLGAMIARFGNIMYFGFCAIFAFQLYGVEVGFIDFILISMISILAGWSTAAQAGILSLAGISFILEPAGIPITGILVILAAADIIIDPIRTVSVIHTNCAAIAWIGKPLGSVLSKQEVEQEEKIEQ